MQGKKFALAGAFLLLLSFSLWGWVERMKFERITTEDGLSQDSVRALFQDHHGYIWAATQDGLNRFDGYSFEVFRHDPENPHSLGANFLLSLAEDSRGRLWAGTALGGLNLYREESGTFQRFLRDPKNSESLWDDTVLSLLSSRSDPDTLWVGTLSGLNRMDLCAKRVIRVPLGTKKEQGPVNALFEDRKGSLWVGGGDGLYRLTSPGRAAVFYPLLWKGGDEGKAKGDKVLSIFQDSRGVYWVGTERGLFRFEPSTGLFHPLFPQVPSLALSGYSARAIVEDKEGFLWVITSRRGIASIDPSRRRVVFYQHNPSLSQSLATNSFFSLLVDKTGVLWAGSYVKGIHKFDPKSRRFLHVYGVPGERDNLQSNLVKTLYEDREGTIWIGTHVGGLYRYDRERERFVSFQDLLKSPYASSIFSIYEDRRERFWVGSGDGELMLLDRRRRRVHSFLHDPRNPSSVGAGNLRSILEDSDGNLWIGTSSGLSRWVEGSERFINHVSHPGDDSSLSNNKIRTVIRDREGYFWVGTENGLNRFDPRTGRSVRYLRKPGAEGTLSHSSILGLLEPKENPDILWVGTAGGGVNRFDKRTGQCRVYRVREGLSSDFVYSILEDPQGKLWMGTNKGISCFDPRTERFSRFDESDGVQGNEFNSAALITSRGEFLLGGQEGLNVFFPDRIRRDLSVPPVVITRFRIFNKVITPGPDSPLKAPLDSGEILRLSYRHKVFSLEFSALHYGSPKKNRFAYKMEGFDRDWNYTDADNRMATYTNLAPGKYTFRVTASNRDGVWNDRGTFLRIHVQPPFWRTTLFTLLLILTGVFSLCLLFWQRRRAYRARDKRRLETEKAMVEISEEIRHQVGMELHDGLSHDLLEIAIKLRLLVKSAPELPRGETEEIEKRLKEAVAKTKRIARGLFPVNLSAGGVPLLLDEIATRVEDDYGIPCLREIDKEQSPTDFLVLTNLYFIAQEAVLNAVRHSGTERIFLSWKAEERGITLRIRDWGKGFSEDLHKSQSMGLRIMEYRARIIGAELSVINVEEGGTEVRCTLL